MNRKPKKAVTWGLIIISVVLIVVGCLRGEPADVLNKAVKVCMQCIGIG